MTRRRIAYSREFLVSVGASSEACRRLPVGFDASKLRCVFFLPCCRFGRRSLYVLSSFAADCGV